MTIALIIIAVIVVALVVLIACAGPIATWYINRRLRDLPGYTGRVERITLSAFAGKGVMKGFVFRERGSSAKLPLADVRSADIDISYRKLWRGRLSVAARVSEAHVHMLAKPPEAAPTPAPAAEKTDKKEAAAKALQKTQRWQDALRQVFPMEIREFRITKSSAEYLDEMKRPPVRIALDDIEVEATGLTNQAPPFSDEFSARVAVSGTLTGHGKLRVLVHANPMASQPRFRCAMKLEQLSLPAWNALLKDVAKIDIAGGTFGCAAEIDAAHGYYRGYIKPVFADLDFTTPPTAKVGFLQRAAKTVMGWAVALLENREGKIAARIPFDGNFMENDVDVWSAVGTLLRNAFVRGLREGLESSFRVHRVAPRPARVASAM